MNDIKKLEELVNESIKTLDTDIGISNYLNIIAKSLFMQVEINKEILRILKEQNESMQ